MKLLFVMDRLHLNEQNGYSINAKRTMEGLTEKGIEVHAVCHGKNEKIKVHELKNFDLYKRAITFPMTSFLTIKKLNEVLKKEKFDAIIAKPLVHPHGKSFWNSLPSLPLSDSIFYWFLRKKAKQQKAKLVYLIDGIAEKNSFASMLVGSTKESHLNQLKNSDGVVVLSNAQRELLQEMGIKNNFFVLPSSVDTKKFFPKNSKFHGIDKNNLNLLYLSSSCSEEDLKPLLEAMKLTNPKIKLFITANPNQGIQSFIDSFDLMQRIIFLGKIPDERLADLINSCDIGVYLKRFDSPIGDASTMVKVSEYLACAKPVLFPEMDGVKEQAGKASISLNNGVAKMLDSLYLNKALLVPYSRKAREQAEKKLDLSKNLNELKLFLEKVTGNE